MKKTNKWFLIKVKEKNENKVNLLILYKCI
jgi:hypothetical protein